MTTAWIRALLAATAVAAVLSYGVSAHALPEMSSHDGMAGAAVGLCLLLATLLGYAPAPRPQAPRPALAVQAAPPYAAPAGWPPLDG